MRLAVLLAALALPAPAAAHGDAAWISRNPAYVDALGTHCCGPSDCKAVPAAVIIEHQDRTELVGHGALRLTVRGHYRSIDERWWACIDTATRKVKCIFHPIRES